MWADSKKPGPVAEVRAIASGRLVWLWGDGWRRRTEESVRKLPSARLTPPLLRNAFLDFGEEAMSVVFNEAVTNKPGPEFSSGSYSTEKS